MWFEALLVIAAAVLVTGFAAVVVFYVHLRRISPPADRPPFLRYFAVAVVAALVAYMAGTWLGIYAACSSPDAGNLCGIWGALGWGPLFAGVALWVYGPLWRWRGFQ